MTTKKVSDSKGMTEAERRVAECRQNADTRLDLSGLGLHHLPETLRELTWLESLRADSNDLTSIPAWIGELVKLRELPLHYNPLTTIPNSVGLLKNLTYLTLDGGRSSAARASIGSLLNLSTLALANLGLESVPDWVGRLRNLEELYLHENHLTTLPDWIGELSRLKVLDLEGNDLRALPPSLFQLKQLETLTLAKNRALRLPTEIVERSTAPKRILDFYFRTRRARRTIDPDRYYTAYETQSLLELTVGTIKKKCRAGEIAGSQIGSKRAWYIRGAEILRLTKLWALTSENQQALNEFKLILVGRGGVGKTTLVHRLTTDKYREFNRTPGIKITKWPVEVGGAKVRAHIWDFGGQEIMHGTHRFFMTERALYLVFISGREGTEDHDAEYWLSLVRSFAGNVPVIVLLNKWDEYSFELNRELLREKYGRRLVFQETDSFTGHGLPDLREKICQLASKLPGLKASWPREWQRIKEELPVKKKSWLTFENFREFCSSAGITKARDQEALPESLHDLGLMLSFRKEEALRDFGVLNPQWITKGIYQILNSELLRASQGKFSATTFAQILPKTKYPEAVHPFLLALMRKFRLCHPLDDKGEKYLIPELLTKEEPNLATEFPREKCLGFVYRYDTVLPEGILPRFIVETYVHREPKYAWRTGVVLERANCRALVRGDIQGRTVTIRVAGVGQGKRELLGIIREHFERIHRNFEKLPVTELVPIPAHPEVMIPYKELLAYEAAGDDEFKVVIDQLPVRFSVAGLIDGVDIPGAQRQIRRTTAPFQRAFPTRQNPLALFISYSHKDERYRDELRGALTAYERKGELSVWDDTCIVPGQEWEPEILDKLERADLIILLLSNDFMRSDYCFLKEMTRARERDAAGECALVPIVIRACPFNKLALGQLQAILPNGKPIKQHKDRDSAWLQVTKQLDRVISRLSKS